MLVFSRGTVNRDIVGSMFFGSIPQNKILAERNFLAFTNVERCPRTAALLQFQLYSELFNAHVQVRSWGGVQRGFQLTKRGKGGY